MNANFLNDPLMEAMGSYMTRLSKRQQVVASNLANIDTPGYKTKDISFHATMRELLEPQAVPLRTTLPEHNSMSELVFVPLEPEVIEVPDLPMRPDRNNVDLDKEMLKLSETSFGYSLMTQLLRGKFRTLINVINDGRSG